MKDKIKKLGMRKNCILTAIILIALLLAILMPKITINKASALSAPQAKRIDLNGITYEYQTSLNELKNNYGLFNNEFTRRLFTIQENTEGENIFTVLASNIIEDPPTNEQLLNLNKIFTFYKNNDVLDSTLSPEPVSNYNKFKFGDTLNDTYLLSDLSNIEINFNKFNTLLKTTSNFSGDFLIEFIYLSEKNDPNTIPLKENTKVITYAISKPLNYNFVIDKLEGYKLRMIACVFSGQKLNGHNRLFGGVPGQLNWLVNHEDNSLIQEENFIIENPIFIENADANIVKFDMDYEYNTNEENPYFKGNLLLSRTKSDTAMFQNMITEKRQTTSQGFASPVYFGSDTNTKINNITFRQMTSGVDPFIPGFFNIQTDKGTVVCVSYPNYVDNNLNISYVNQNQLLFVPEMQDLRIKPSATQTYDGAGLSAQVEDVLYNVQNLGSTQQIEQDEEIQKDFENMLYVTGAFAVIGLLLGFLFGNPVLGLVLGAVIGFGLTIIPIILDGLQAIFGQQFLDGLQNFFRSIASAIAGVVSSILNFLFGIITNPAVLVLVLIVTILYLFVFRKK